MLELIDRFYAILPHTNVVNSSFRFGIRVMANWWVRYFMPIKQKCVAIKEDTIIVSLTTYPARIKTVWMTIACLLNQDYKNMRVILWLSKEQFHDLSGLPSYLQKLQKKGLVIKFKDDDLRSHKKYYYAFSEYPQNIVVTVDDDILYHPHLISALVENHLQHPADVICNRAVNIDTRNKYSLWSHSHATNSSWKILPTGIGGVLYPPNSLDARIYNVDAIKQTCINGDDLWLNFMCRLKGTKVTKTAFKTGLITILSSQDTALCNTNCGENKNDQQIDSISQWANTQMNIDFFYRVEE